MPEKFVLFEFVLVGEHEPAEIESTLGFVIGLEIVPDIGRNGETDLTVHKAGQNRRAHDGDVRHDEEQGDPASAPF